MIEMYVALAFVLMLIPLGALYFFEWLARAGKGPLAQPDRMIVLDGIIIPALGPAVPLVDAVVPEPATPIDDDACAAESLLVTALMAGELDRTEYQRQMADLAAAGVAT